MAELFKIPHLQAVLQEMAADLAENYRDQLGRSGRNASRNLLNSVTARVALDRNVWEVQLSLLEYWKYIEYGTRPHWPPPEKILEWITVKPVIPRPGRDGRIPTPKQLAYLIGRKIARVGTEGKPDLQETVERLMPWYERKISEALGTDASEYIKTTFMGQ